MFERNAFANKFFRRLMNLFISFENRDRSSKYDRRSESWNDRITIVVIKIFIYILRMYALITDTVQYCPVNICFPTS